MATHILVLDNLLFYLSAFEINEEPFVMMILINSNNEYDNNDDNNYNNTILSLKAVA